MIAHGGTAGGVLEALGFLVPLIVFALLSRRARRAPAPATKSGSTPPGNTPPGEKTEPTENPDQGAEAPETGAG